MTQFLGKYRGKVESNTDPSGLGRLQVSVPAVLGSGQQSWAMPCTPYAGSGVGFFAIPPTGANVWVEFEAGDPDYPIWSGCFWGSGECPASPAVADKKIFKTGTCTITIDDSPGAGSIKIETDSEIKLATSSGVEIKMSSSGIEITNGKGATVKLDGTSVKLNDSALEVT